MAMRASLEILGHSLHHSEAGGWQPYGRLDNTSFSAGSISPLYRRVHAWISSPSGPYGRGRVFTGWAIVRVCFRVFRETTKKTPLDTRIALAPGGGGFDDPRAPPEPRRPTVPDHAAVEALPRFARDIAVLAGDGPSTHGPVVPAEPCVLAPFSGVLDVRLDRGRVPTLDLSYLTLASLVTRARAGTAARERGPRSPGTTLAETPAGPATRDVETGGDEGDGPKVRDVIHDQRPTDREGTREGAPPHADASIRTHLDLDAGHPGDRLRPGDAKSSPAEVSRERDASTTVDRSRRSEPSSRQEPIPRPEPTRTTLDRGPGEPASPPDVGETGRSDGPSSEPTDRPRDRTAPRPSGTTLDPTDAPAGRTDPSVPDRTVVNRSGPGVVSSDRSAGRAPPPDDGGPSVATTDVEPPRMVATREASQPEPRDAREVGRRPTGSAAEATTAGTSPADAGTAGPEAGPSSPRMVVDRGDSTATPSDDGTDRGEVSPGDGRAEPPGRDLNDRMVDVDERLATVVEASRDPESRLVDRLYRALEERRAIEQRRRGER